MQRWKDGVRVLQIQGGRCGQMCASWQRGGGGGRLELKQAFAASLLECSIAQGSAAARDAQDGGRVELSDDVNVRQH